MSRRAQQLMFGQILLTANRMQHRLDPLLPVLTLKQWLTLIVLHNQPQPVDSVATISAIMGTSHQNTTKLVLALERSGFVDLHPSPNDRRARQIALTDAARDYLVEHERAGELILDRMFRGTPPGDIATCLEVLDTIHRNLDTIRRDIDGIDHNASEEEQ